MGLVIKLDWRLIWKLDCELFAAPHEDVQSQDARIDETIQRREVVLTRAWPSKQCSLD
jgi:hypothetical protein